MLRVRLHESPKCARKMRDGIWTYVGVANLWDNITPACVNATRALH